MSTAELEWGCLTAGFGAALSRNAAWSEAKTAQLEAALEMGKAA